jgi:CDP-diacylglycerol--serine O-phosphatidyltransferase
MRRAVILFPSGLTLGNLFFGVFAIVAASRLEFTTAGVYVLLGGICDALDGRVARATNAGTQFGEELDSLVDAITFGLAPGMIMYFAVLNRDGWDWVWVFLFAACAVLRLARFNIEQAGTAKTYFQGLPSPAAGITLASYYWFSQSWLYNYGAIADLKWHVLLRYLMVVLSFLMISNIPYPTFPRTGFRSLRAIGATVLVFGSIVLLATRKLEFFFPFALIYVAWGIVRWVFFGLFERRQPTVPYDLSEGEDDDDDEEFELTDSRVHATRQGHRDERLPRVEAPRTRLERTTMEETKLRPSATRPSEKPERAARTDRPARLAEGERGAERGARRDKKKDREKRPDRPERPAAAKEVASAAAASPAPAPPAVTSSPPPSATSGVGAITLNPSPPELTLADEEEPTTAVADAAAALSPDGAPARKRKRRRRRGDRKDRGASEATNETAAPAAHADSSPYAPAAFSTSPAASSSADVAPIPPSVPAPLPPPDLEPAE